jgi:hypothetical protein
VTVIAMAGVALVAGGGSGSSNKAAPTSSARQTTPPASSKRSAKSKSAAHSKSPLFFVVDVPEMAWNLEIENKLAKQIETFVG